MGSFLRFFLPKNTTVITLAPFGIYFKNEKNIKFTYIVNREKIHWRQQMEMFIIPYYVWYMIEYLIKVIIYGEYAHASISFEREAYKYNTNPMYYINRKRYAWIQFIFKNYYQK